MRFEVLLADARATEALGAALGALIAPGDVVLLIGALGAGKTTLVRGLVGALAPGESVTSPTFTLRHEYATSPPLTHVDCWRLASEAELVELGLDEVLDEGGALLVEWGELARARFGARALELHLEEREQAPGRVALLVDTSGSFTGRLAPLRAELAERGLELAAIASDEAGR